MTITATFRKTKHDYYELVTLNPDEAIQRRQGGGPRLVITPARSDGRRVLKIFTRPFDGWIMINHEAFNNWSLVNGAWWEHKLSDRMFAALTDWKAPAPAPEPEPGPAHVPAPVQDPDDAPAPVHDPDGASLTTPEPAPVHDPDDGRRLINVAGSFERNDRLGRWEQVTFTDVAHSICTMGSRDGHPISWVTDAGEVTLNCWMPADQFRWRLNYVDLPDPVRVEIDGEDHYWRTHVSPSDAQAIASMSRVPQPEKAGDFAPKDSIIYTGMDVVTALANDLRLRSQGKEVRFWGGGIADTHYVVPAQMDNFQMIEQLGIWRFRYVSSGLETGGGFDCDDFAMTTRVAMIREHHVNSIAAIRVAPRPGETAGHDFCAMVVKGPTGPYVQYFEPQFSPYARDAQNRNRWNVTIGQGLYRAGADNTFHVII